MENLRVFDDGSDEQEERTFSENRSKFRNDPKYMKKRRREMGQSSQNRNMQPNQSLQEIKLRVPSPPVHGIKMESQGNDEIVTDLMDTLSVEQIDMFRRTCFGKYLDMPFHKLQGAILRCLLEVEIVQNNPNEFWACVRGKVLKYNLHHFALVTGLNAPIMNKSLITPQHPFAHLSVDTSLIVPLRKKS